MVLLYGVAMLYVVMLCCMVCICFCPMELAIAHSQKDITQKFKVYVLIYTWDMAMVSSNRMVVPSCWWDKEPSHAEPKSRLRRRKTLYLLNQYDLSYLSALKHLNICSFRLMKENGGKDI